MLNETIKLGSNTKLINISSEVISVESNDKNQNYEILKVIFKNLSLNDAINKGVFRISCVSAKAKENLNCFKKTSVTANSIVQLKSSQLVEYPSNIATGNNWITIQAAIPSWGRSEFWIGITGKSVETRISYVPELEDLSNVAVINGFSMYAFLIEYYVNILMLLLGILIITILFWLYSLSRNSSSESDSTDIDEHHIVISFGEKYHDERINEKGLDKK